MEPRPEEQKSSSLLAFLRLLLREATERSNSWKRRNKKRYWANVSEVFFQSQDAARKLLRRAKREFGISLARKPRLENLLDSSIENNVSGGAFQGCFTMKFERHVAFPMVRIAFMLSDVTGTSVASREGEGSRALVF